MEKALVSVLTITRNRGDLLKRCISSVLLQTYTNIEHIIIDGASDDNTDEVVASFRDERLKFHKLDYNWPLKETIDYGISLCRGKYITFLDSDDEYLSTKIEKQVSLIETLSEDYGFVYCWMTYYNSINNEIDHIHDTQLRGDVSDIVLGEPIISGTPTLLFRAEVIRELDGWKSKDEIGIVSDWELCARACQKYKVDFVPESLVNVYVNHGSVRQSENKKYYDDSYVRVIKFSNYFLNTFSDTFRRRPELAAYHYYSIAVSKFRLKSYYGFCKYLFKSFHSDPCYTVGKLFKRK